MQCVEEAPLFGLVTERGTRVLRSGERFVLCGEAFQYLHRAGLVAVLCHLDEHGALSDCPAGFVMYSDALRLHCNECDSPYGWSMDVGRDYTLTHSSARRPILRMESLVV
jgi:hypothetical protein